MSKNEEHVPIKILKREAFGQKPGITGSQDIPGTRKNILEVNGNKTEKKSAKTSEKRPSIPKERKDGNANDVKEKKSRGKKREKTEILNDRETDNAEGIVCYHIQNSLRLI